MNKKKKGFTLAEVLITLMAIGIVAAITIPMLLNSIRDKDRQVAFKKSVSILSEAVQQVSVRDVSCGIIEDSDDLAACLHKVYVSGTLSGNVITVADSATYTFFWRKGSPGYFEDCGSQYSMTEAGWTGADANCVVVADVDGPFKGESGVDDLVTKEKITAQPGDEQFPLVISLMGVRAVYYEGSLGYKYMFGDENFSKKPWEELVESSSSSSNSIGE